MRVAIPDAGFSTYERVSGWKRMEAFGFSEASSIIGFAYRTLKRR